MTPPYTSKLMRHNIHIEAQIFEVFKAVAGGGHGPPQPQKNNFFYTWSINLNVLLIILSICTNINLEFIIGHYK
jgi:hypothetical protein